MGSFGEGLAKFRRNRRVWETRRATPSLVHDAAVGSVVTVEGTIDAETLLRSPLTHTSTVGYVAHLAELVYFDGDPNPIARPIAHDEKTIAFVVVDAAGDRVRVEAGSVLLGDEPTDVRERAVLRQNPELQALVKNARIEVEHLLLEHCLVAGDRVRVTGRVGEASDVVAAGYRDAAGRMKTLGGTEDEPLVVVKV